LIIVGTVTESKGQVDAIYAVKRLIEKKYDVELVIKDPSYPGYMGNLNKTVAEESLESSIKFFGFDPNPYPAFNQADIVLVCLRNEAFGLVIVEGMLLKKPVIGTNIGGIP
jgi:glycosyltransferase involved in cell wall biosynthesis